MPVLCPWCDEKPEGFRSSSSLRVHVKHKHEDNTEEYERKVLEKTLERIKSTTKSDSSELEKIPEQIRKVVNFEEWDADDVDEYIDTEAEIELARQQVKLSRLRFKKWKYDNPQAYNSMAQTVVSQPNQGINTKDVIDIVKMFKTDDNQFSIDKVKSWVEFAQTLQGGGGDASDDLMKVITSLAPMAGSVSQGVPVSPSLMAGDLPKNDGKVTGQRPEKLLTKEELYDKYLEAAKNAGYVEERVEKPAEVAKAKPSPKTKK